MPLHPDDSKIAIAYLESKCPSMRCIACESEDPAWRVQDIVLLPNQSRAATPYVAVDCKHCGAAVFFSPSAMGISERA